MKTTRQAHQNKYSILIGKTWSSPARAILLHSPGRKPWVRHCNTFIEPQRGGTLLSKTNARAVSAAPYRSSIRICLCVPRVSYRALPSFHPGLCRSIVPKDTRRLRIKITDIGKQKIRLRFLFSKPRRSLYRLQP